MGARRGGRGEAAGRKSMFAFIDEMLFAFFLLCLKASGGPLQETSTALLES